MQNLTPVLLFVGFTVLIVVVSTVLGRRQMLRAKANLAALAADLGLELGELPPVLGVFPRLPTVRGQYGGRTLRFFSFTTGSGKSRQVWQALGLSCANPHGLTLQLGSQNFLSAIGTMLGMQDVQVGDAAFDQRFVVKTSDPDYLRAALLPELRAELLQRWSQRCMGANVKLSGGEIVYAELGSFAETAVAERMKALLPPLSALATLPEVYRS